MARTPTGNRRIPSLSRRTLLKGAVLAGLPAFSASFLAPCRPAAAQAKPYAGKSITVWTTNHIYTRGLKELLPATASKVGWARLFSSSPACRGDDPVTHLLHPENGAIGQAQRRALDLADGRHSSAGSRQ